MDEFGKELESAEKKLKGKAEKTDYYHKKFYGRFAEEILEYQNTGKLPANSSPDLNILLEYKQKKLESLGDDVTEIHSISPLSEVTSNGFSSEKYNYRRLSKAYRREIQVYNKKSGRSFSKKDNVYLNENILFAKPDKINDGDTFCCPSCGQISTLKQLEHGCMKCKTSTFITELFPKVTNFFNIKNTSITLTDIIKKLVICGLLGFAIGIPAGAVTMISDMSRYMNKEIMMKIISNVFTAPFKGMIAGIVASVFWILGCFIYFSVKRSPSIEKMNSTKKSIKTFMAKYDDNFSFDFFESKIVFLTKLLIYSDDREKLPICKLDHPVRKFDIIDSIYSGIFELKKIKAEDNICTVELEINMSNIHDNGTKFYCRDDVFIMKLQKNISKPIKKEDFEIKKILCSECSKWFDGWDNKTCPSCGKEYELSNNDWIVKEFKLK